MPSVPFATLSVHKFISSVGADCGFAAIVGLALLVVLYFASARETATLRDQLEDAHDLIESLEVRVQQLMRQQSQQGLRQAPLSAPVPASVPVSPRPMGSALATMRPVVPAGPSPQAQSVMAALFSGARPGLGGPALGSATRMVPDPLRDLPYGDGAASNGANGATVVGAAAVAAAARTTVATAPPPRRVSPEDAALNRDRYESPVNGGGPPRRIPPVAPQSGGPGLLAEESQRSPLRRALPLVLGVVIVVLVVGAIIKLSHTPGSAAQPPVAHAETGAATKSGSVRGFVAGDWTVSVLNGTAVSGLAADVSTALVKKGFKPGNITNAASQAQSTSVVYYVAKSDRAAADRVAADLKIKRADIQPADASALQSCATGNSGSAATCHAQVIVSVGSDESSYAASGSS
jgi:hypothetical protein